MTPLAPLAVFLAASLGAQDAPRVTFDDLLNALVNLDWLATPPPAGERCVQFSSYDRSSAKGRADADAWFGNSDWGQYLRSEKHGDRTEWVMAETDGPGAIVRIWSANPSGDLRFYFDGAEEASWTIPFEDLTGGKKAPFVEPLCGVRSSGWNCTVPFPFAKRVKVTVAAQTPEKIYFHVNVRLFPAGTNVPTFTTAMLDRPALAATLESLRRREPPVPPPGWLFRKSAMLVPPNERKEHVLQDRGVLRLLKVRVEARDVRTAMRAIRLRMTFDAPPSEVDCPLGDFFGTAPDFTPYATAALGVSADGTGWCALPIPIGKSASIALQNEGAEPVTVTCETWVDPKPIDTPLHFHAKWRQQRDVKTQPRSDYVVLDADGPGRLVGVALSVRNPVREWWGEGDEHAWVDGESFPSWFGTGTEDFFGYAWCDPHPFSAAFHSESRCDGPGFRGYTAVNRFLVGDSIPFRKSLRFELEIWHWAKTEVDYATVAYWYAPAGAADRFEPMPPVAERLPRDLPPVASKFPGAIEAEELFGKARVTGGQLSKQDMAGFGDAWSRDEQLWWARGKVGDQIALPLEVKDAGAYAVRAQFTKAADYGIVQPAIDGKPLGSPIDLYNAGVVATGDLELGRAELAAGAHVLTFTILGANPSAAPQRMVGIDYVRLVR